VTMLIEHIIEPDRLLLSWQAQDSEARSRYVVAELLNQQEGVTLNYLTESSDFQLALEHGFSGHPAFQVSEGSTFDNQVLDAFSRRLPPRNRSDFPRYLELRGINPSSNLSEFALLGYTGAKLPDDGFEIYHPFSGSPPKFEIIIEIAGFRHKSEINSEDLNLNDRISFVSEPDNIHDANAIRIELEGTRLGYVSHSNVDMFQRYLSEGYNIEADVFRKNGTADRPLIYLFTRFSLEK